MIVIRRRLADEGVLECPTGETLGRDDIACLPQFAHARCVFQRDMSQLSARARSHSEQRKYLEVLLAQCFRIARIDARV
jgi:hypothetical protein